MAPSNDHGDHANLVSSNNILGSWALQFHLKADTKTAYEDTAYKDTA